MRALPGGAQRRSPVGLPDRAAQALAGGGELVLELEDPPLCVTGLGGAGVALGGELATGGLEGGDPGDQVSAVGPVDLGAELEAQTAA